MTEKKQKKKPRSYTDEFKQLLLHLCHNGKRKCDICREYDMASSLLDKCLKHADTSDSFHEKDNRIAEQEELIALHKRLKQLEMENDILKQAALMLEPK